MEFIAVAFFLASASLILMAMRTHAKSPQQESEDPYAWMPAELRQAELLAVEKDAGFLINLPKYGLVRFTGRPDQVYRLGNGLATPVELKNRHQARVEQRDFEQLTLQGWLLRNLGVPTHEFGYIIYQIWGSQRRVVVPVRLGSDDFARSILIRHMAIISGTVKPRRALNTRCNSCFHQAKCN